MVNIIETINLKKKYLMGNVEVHALKGVDIRIKEGEFVAVMGSSGSGKSTLLNMIGILDIPTSGHVIINGTNVSEMNENQRADFRLKKLGFIFQFFNLFIELTALENVSLPILIAGMKDSNERAQKLLDQVGLSDRMNHKPTELSGGQQQRVTIARALANEPSLLLADEPTANLDSSSSEQIIELLIELNRSGQTIVMVTHELELGRRADRIIRLRDGMIENY